MNFREASDRGIYRVKNEAVKILVYKIVHEFLQRRPFCD
nr:MAG TPA: hypothetical protein [Caudoviricetes sp.]